MAELPSFEDDIVDFETLDGRMLAIRRADAETMQAEGLGQVAAFRNREDPILPTGEAPGPVTPPPDTSLGPTAPGGVLLDSLSQAPTQLNVPQPTGPAGIVPESLESASPLPVDDKPVTEQQLREQLATQGLRLGPDGTVVPLDTPQDIAPEPPILPSDTRPLPESTPGTIQEAQALQESRTTPVTAPRVSSSQPRSPRPISPQSTATGPVTPTLDQQLLLQQREAEERVLRSQQGAALLRAQGFEDEAALIEANIGETEATVADRKATLQQERQAFEAQRAERAKRIAELESELANTDIQDNRGFGQKLLGGISMAIFQIGSTIAGRPGTPNAAMQIINQGIQQDLAEQKRKAGTTAKLLGSERTELAKLTEALGDGKAAELKLEEIRLGQVGNKLNALRARGLGAQQEAGADALAAQLEERRANVAVQAKAAADQAEANAMQKRRAQRLASREKRLDRESRERIALSKIAAQRAKDTQDFGSKIGDEVARLEGLSFERNIDERMSVGNRLFKLANVEGNNPQTLAARVSDAGFLKKFLQDADESEARALQEMVVLMAGAQKVKGAASDRDIEMMRRGVGAGFFDNPEVANRIISRFVQDAQRDEATLLAGSKDPRAAAIFKRRKDRAINDVNSRPQFRTPSVNFIDP